MQVEVKGLPDSRCLASSQWQADCQNGYVTCLHWQADHDWPIPPLEPIPGHCPVFVLGRAAGLLGSQAPEAVLRSLSGG